MDGAAGNRNCRDTRASIRQCDCQILAVRRLPAFQRLDDDDDAVVTREGLEPFARLVQRLDRDADGTVTQRCALSARISAIGAATDANWFVA